VIISPDGKYFPYEALVVDDQTSDPNYFIDDHAVSYTYSARYLLYNISIQSDNSSSNNFIGIAPVHFSNFNLPDLPGSAESLDKIEKLYTHTFNLTSEQAKKKDFLEKFPSYKLIQLYTHASDTSNSGEPIIYFADSAVYLSDLISIGKTSSQLIVLSACETSNGMLMQGEGVFSFNRGFASLGIPATVSNIWSIDNQSTYEITEIFYKNLSKAMPIDVALQKAKLEFISNASKQKKLPYYWAAAILVGKTDAIEMSKPLHWTWIAVAAGLFVAGILFFLFKRKNKTRIN
jgi:CHAT domain-containing protein